MPIYLTTFHLGISLYIAHSWNNWSNWSPSGPCQGTSRSYARSRMCISSSIEPSSSSNTQDPCVAGDWQVDYANKTTYSGCPQAESIIVLGITTVVAFTCLTLGLLMAILCVRTWARRNVYNVR